MEANGLPFDDIVMSCYSHLGEAIFLTGGVAKVKSTSESSSDSRSVNSRSSTTCGSAKVDKSPNWSPSPATIFRKIRRMIFPDRVFGRMSSITYCRNELLSVTERCIRYKTGTHNLLGSSKRSNSLSYLNRQFLLESTRCSWLKVRLGGNERVHSLTSQLVCSADNSGFRNTVVNDQGAFDLSSTDSVTGHVDDVVHSTLDPVVTFVVSSDSIAVVEVSRVRLEVGFDVTSVIAVDGSCQRWPRLLADDDTFNIVSFQKLAGRGVQETYVMTQEGERCRTGLGCSRTRDRSNADRAGLRHPVRVNDGALSSSDVVVVPVPCFRVDRFTDTANDSQTREILVLDIRVAKSSKQSNSL